MFPLFGVCSRNGECFYLFDLQCEMLRLVDSTHSYAVSHFVCVCCLCARCVLSLSICTFSSQLEFQLKRKKETHIFTHSAQKCSHARIHKYFILANNHFVTFGLWNSFHFAFQMMRSFQFGDKMCFLLLLYQEANAQHDTSDSFPFISFIEGG